MKKIFLFIILISTTIFAESTLNIKNGNLFLWNRFRVVFGSFEYKMFDKMEYKRVGLKSYQISSKTLVNINKKEIPVEFTVNAVDHDNFIDLAVKAKFNGKVELRHGLGTFIFDVKSEKYSLQNHATSLISKKPFIEGFNVVNFENSFSLYMSNPLNSHIQFNDNENFVFVEMVPQMKTRESGTKQSPVEFVRQILDSGEVVEQKFSIFKENLTNAPMISAIPNGHTEAMSIIWDEIPMLFNELRHSTFDLEDPATPELYKRMRELYDLDKKYKASFVISFDYVDHRESSKQLDKSVGDALYEITGPYDLTKDTPQKFKDWMASIENSTGEEWTQRTSLGLHALHHTYIEDGESHHESYHEFDCMDSLEVEKSFERIFNSLTDIGITENSMKVMRFPGMKFTDIAWQKAVEKGIKYMCFACDYNKNKEHNFSHFWGKGKNTSWGFKTAYWTDHFDGDTKEKYYVFLSELSKGIPLLVGGHPHPTVARDPAYKFFKEFLCDIQEETEDMEYFLPDSLAIFYDKLKTVNIDFITYDQKGTHLHLSGNFPEDFTIVLPDVGIDKIITSENCGIKKVTQKRENLYVTLNQFNGLQEAIISIDDTIKFNNYDSLHDYGNNYINMMVAPNPSIKKAVFIVESKNSISIDYIIVNIHGETLKKGTLQPLSGYAEIDISDAIKNYKGIYFIKLEDENGVEIIDSFYKL